MRQERIPFLEKKEIALRISTDVFFGNHGDRQKMGRKWEQCRCKLQWGIGWS